jgi:flagellar biosynthesis protein FlhG
MADQPLSQPQLPNETTDMDAAEPNSHGARIIAVTSGKGGVGKTNVTTNLGIALAMRGSNVCIFDADTGLANVNILLGLRPERTLEHFLKDDVPIDDVLLHGPRDVKIVPGASGIAEYAQLGMAEKSKLLAALQHLERRYDYLLIDTAAGLSDSVLAFVQSAQYAVVVISPDPTSLTDAFALIKSLKQRDYQQPIYALVNMATSFQGSMDVFKRFHAAVQKYLNTNVRYLGYIPLDEHLIASVRLQRPVVLAEPHSPAGRSFKTLADAIDKNFRFSSAPNSLSGYWREQAIAAESVAVEAPVEIANPEEPAASSTPAVQISPQSAMKSMEEPEAQDLIEGLIDDFVKRFGRFPFDFRQSAYRALDMEGFPEAAMRDMVMALEAAYQQLHNKPMRDFQDHMFALLVDLKGSKERQQALAREMQQRHQKEFEEPLFDAPAALLEAARSGAMDAEAVDAFVKQLEQARDEQLGREPTNDREELMAEVQAVLARMQKQESDLRNGLTRLSDWFGQTVAAREELSRHLAGMNLGPDDKTGA